MLTIQERKYRLTGIRDMLATQPADPDIRKKYIGSRAPEGKDVSDEEAAGDENLSGVQVFLRDEDGHVCLADYMIKGFFKEALTNIREDAQVAQAASKIDNYVGICERFIPITHDGTPCMKPDGIKTRPLRGQTMQGPRTALTTSEIMRAGWQIEFTVRLLANRGTARSLPVTFEALEQALDYGEKFKGIGQWRNAQHGRFTWEVVNDE